MQLCYKSDDISWNTWYHFVILIGGEVPATKLAALQKVLQSEFLNAVREVYEHVYETVDVQGNPEIRASATAKVERNIMISFLFQC